jgi:Zn-dependent protease
MGIVQVLLDYCQGSVTVLSIVLGPFGMYYWTLKAVTLTTAEGLNALHDQAFIVNNVQLWIGIILQIISLIAMFIISVFKPWGPRKQKNQPNLA